MKLLLRCKVISACFRKIVSVTYISYTRIQTISSTNHQEQIVRWTCNTERRTRHQKWTRVVSLSLFSEAAISGHFAKKTEVV